MVGVSRVIGGAGRHIQGIRRDQPLVFDAPDHVGHQAGQGLDPRGAAGNRDRIGQGRGTGRDVAPRPIEQRLRTGRRSPRGTEGRITQGHPTRRQQDGQIEPAQKGRTGKAHSDRHAVARHITGTDRPLRRGHRRRPGRQRHRGGRTVDGQRAVTDFHPIRCCGRKSTDHQRRRPSTVNRCGDITRQPLIPLVRETRAHRGNL